ncbi:hypothetical protein H0X06_00815 [Candidatus Dependentiae bacterium]|nr:hypothetical protein [Candidatus Dependentiae bacterium]
MQKRLITIFIHGTVPPDTLRNLPILKDIFWCPLGLHPLTSLEEHHLVTLGYLMCTTNSRLFDKDFFYLFGWTGKLLSSERKKAAAELYAQLSELTNKLLLQGTIASFRLIAHSHGGNVALNLSRIKSTAILCIEEVILIACPVQKETAPYINSSMFRSIISIHSHFDIIQKIDPQGVYNFLESIKSKGLEFTVTHLKQVGPFFSLRHFENASNLIEVHAKYSHRELLHIEFIQHEFIEALPALIECMENSQIEKPGIGQEITYILDKNKECSFSITKK